MNITDTFGVTIMEISKEDIKTNPHKPIIRMYDDTELEGIFNILTNEVVYSNDLADYDIEYATDYISKNRSSLLETWEDYKGMYKYA